MSLLAVLGRPGAETALYSRLLSARLRCEVLSVPKAAAMEAAAGTHLGSKLLQTVDADVGKSFRYARLDESLYMGTFIVARKPSEGSSR